MRMLRVRYSDSDESPGCAQRRKGDSCFKGNDWGNKLVAVLRALQEFLVARQGSSETLGYSGRLDTRLQLCDT